MTMVMNRSNCIVYIVHLTLNNVITSEYRLIIVIVTVMMIIITNAGRRVVYIVN